MKDAFNEASIGSFPVYKIQQESQLAVNKNAVAINFLALDLPPDHHDQLHVTVNISADMTKIILLKLLDDPELASLAITKLGPNTL